MILLEENIDETLQNIGMNKDFSRSDLKAKGNKSKDNTMGWHETEELYLAQQRK